MATVLPLEGVLYNQDKISDMADVATPPYDVISAQEEEAFFNRHENNMVRLILGSPREGDDRKENCHTRAGAHLRKWLGDKTMVRDTMPAFYITATEFTMDGDRVTRLGLTALVKLEPFEKGIVLPHERTFSKVKSERLERFRQCAACLSSVFSLFPDNGDILGQMRTAVKNREPAMDFTDSHGQQQKLWRITDKAFCDRITALMAAKKIFIADGHHRYETALAYRDELAAEKGSLPDSHPANFTLMYLASMEDAGLIIRPAHRLLHGIEEASLTAFVDKAQERFAVEAFENPNSDTEAAGAAFLSRLETAPPNTFGICLRNSRTFYLLTPRPEVVARCLAEVPEALRDIDVTILTRLFLMETLGYDKDRLDNEKLISYSSVAADAIDAAVTGRCDIAAILNPTRMDQVKKVAEEGLIMPRKATYFYPKVITGQVLYMLR